MQYPVGYNLNNQYGIQSAGYANNLGLQGQTPFMGQSSAASIYPAYNTQTPNTLQYNDYNTNFNQMMNLGTYQALADPGGGLPEELLGAQDGVFEPSYEFESSEEWNILAALGHGFTHWHEANPKNLRASFDNDQMKGFWMQNLDWASLKPVTLHHLH